MNNYDKCKSCNIICKIHGIVINRSKKINNNWYCGDCKINVEDENKK